MGVIARDDSGSILLERLVLQNHVASAFTAEALACQLTVRIGLENRWRRVIVEGDSLSIVRKCQFPGSDNSLIAPLIINIKIMGKNFQEITFTFVPRSSNERAHNLANLKLKEWKQIYLARRELSALSLGGSAIRLPDG